MAAILHLHWSPGATVRQMDAATIAIRSGIEFPTSEIVPWRVEATRRVASSWRWLPTLLPSWNAAAALRGFDRAWLDSRPLRPRPCTLIPALVDHALAGAHFAPDPDTRAALVVTLFGVHTCLREVQIEVDLAGLAAELVQAVRDGMLPRHRGARDAPAGFLGADNLVREWH